MSAAAVRYLRRPRRRGRLDLVDTQRPVVKGEVPACMGTSYALFQLLARSDPLPVAAGVRSACVWRCWRTAACAPEGSLGGGQCGQQDVADDKAFVGLTIRRLAGARFTPGVRFVDLVRNRGRPVGGVAGHGRYDPDAATRELTAHGLPRLPNFYFNLRQPRIPGGGAGRSRSPERSSIPAAAGSSGKCSRRPRRLPVRIQCFTAPQSIGLILKYDDRMFTRADITASSTSLRTWTVTVAGDPDVPVTDLLVKA